MYVGFNNTIPPFDNVKVRQAIAMALDRQRIVDNYFPEGSTVAEQFTPDIVHPGHTKDFKTYPYDVEGAKALLAEAGFPNGFETELAFRNVVRAYLPLADKVAQEVQAQLAEVGITAKINQMESTTFLDAVDAGQVGLYLLGWVGDYADATNWFDSNFDLQQPDFGAIDPRIVEAQMKAGQTADPVERQKYYDEVNQLVHETLPFAVVAHGGSAMGYKLTVEGAYASPFGTSEFYVMSNGTDQFVFMQNAEPASIFSWDENDDESFGMARQMYNTLTEATPDGVNPELAESWEANADATEFVFKLREGVKYHNGADFDANDVVNFFMSMWDASNPNHVGRTGNFEYFNALFGTFLNAE